MESATCPTSGHERLSIPLREGPVSDQIIIAVPNVTSIIFHGDRNFPERNLALTKVLWAHTDTTHHILVSQQSHFYHPFEITVEGSSSPEAHILVSPKPCDHLLNLNRTVPSPLEPSEKSSEDRSSADILTRPGWPRRSQSADRCAYTPTAPLLCECLFQFLQERHVVHTLYI